MNHPRIVHLISEFSTHEAMGRTVTETALRTPGEHHLITTRIHDGGEVFASVHELEGRIETFPLGSKATLHELIASIQPDVVHLHAGALGPILALASGLRGLPLVMTIYAWPGLPGRAAWKHAGWKSMRASNVLAARVALTAALPVGLARTALRWLNPKGVLSPDPRVLERLADCGIPVVKLPSGAPVDARRASRNTDGAPTVVFAGRAESVRGIRTLIDAFGLVLKAIPEAKLRLLLIPRPELESLRDAVAQSPGADSIELLSEPIGDLLGELAKAQVGAWPFLADYTTSPPAMALAEAMAVGLPVVSTPVACVRAILSPGIDGVAVPPGDSQALADALTELLTKADVWEKYSAAGLRAVQHLSWDSAAEATNGLYRQSSELAEVGV